MFHLNIAFNIVLECLLIVFLGNKLSNLFDVKVVLSIQVSFKILKAIVMVQIKKKYNKTKEQMNDCLKEGKK